MDQSHAIDPPNKGLLIIIIIFVISIIIILTIIINGLLAINIIIIPITIIIITKVSSSVASLALTGSRLAIGFNCGAVEVLSHHLDVDDENHNMMISLDHLSHSEPLG